MFIYFYVVFYIDPSASVSFIFCFGIVRICVASNLFSAVNFYLQLFLIYFLNTVLHSSNSNSKLPQCSAVGHAVSYIWGHQEWDIHILCLISSFISLKGVPWLRLDILSSTHWGELLPWNLRSPVSHSLTPLHKQCPPRDLLESQVVLARRSQERPSVKFT